MNEALIVLEQADTLDGYATACKNSSINSAARKFCQYVPWNDQTFSMKVPDAKVIIMTPSAEGGMPHTRAPNIICIPAYFPEKMLSETIRHELVHIDQRKNPEAWKKRLAKEGWTPIPEFRLPSDWVKRCRLNPDTYDARFWAWEGRYVPMPIFEREDKPELKEISVRWWDLESERLNVDPPTSFTRKFGNLGASQAEHPYELMAYK